jgi:type I restriction enzyme S subunit
VVLSAIAGGKLVRSDDHFTKRVYSKETDRYLLVEQWDFAYNPSRINIGSIGMLKEDIIGGVSPVYVVLRPRTAYRWFLEFSLCRSQITTWIKTLASGSVRQSLSYRDFSTIPSVLPPKRLAEEFNGIWSRLHDSIRCREAETEVLAALRDALLPELISGEVRAIGAASLLEAAV